MEYVPKVLFKKGHAVTVNSFVMIAYSLDSLITQGEIVALFEEGCLAVARGLTSNDSAVETILDHIESLSSRNLARLGRSDGE